jgi:hypothetical protein
MGTLPVVCLKRDLVVVVAVVVPSLETACYYYLVEE